MKKIYSLSILILVSNFTFSTNWVGFDSSLPTKFEAKSIQSSSESSEVQFKLNGYSLTPIETQWGTHYKVETEGGSSIMKSGNPDLDQVFASLVVPDNTSSRLEIVSSSFTEIENIDVAPSKGNLTRDVSPSDIPFSKSVTYNQNKFYPGELASLRDPYILRDFRGQTVVSYPFQYNPVTRTLRVYTDITVRIINEGQGDKNILRRSSSINEIDAEFKSIYQKQFINFEDTQTRFEYLADQGNMLIICYDAFMPQMEPFVQWKNRKGIPTEMVGVSSIGSSSNAIKSYVENYYSTNGLTFLLLVGDIDQIPSPLINGSAADPSYGFILGNDSYAEVIVGRFSGSTPAHINTQVERTLTYEQNPTQTEHFNRALGIASNQGTGMNGFYDDEFQDWLWESLLSSYTYEQFDGIYDPNGSVLQGVNIINQGVGIINYTGHAGPTGWGNGSPIDVSDVESLSNNGRLPFIWTVGCNPGEFNNYSTSFTESWLRSVDSEGNAIGAVGHLGSTISQSWEPPMHGQWAFNSILVENFNNEFTKSFGGISANGCMHMNDAQGAAGVNETNHWTLFGDPSLVVRTDSPTDLNVMYDSSLVLGQENFIVDVGVDGALVAISREGDLISSAYSNGGVAILSLNPNDITPGIVDLVVTAFNKNLYESELAIISPSGPYLIYSSFSNISNSFDAQYIEASNTINLNLLVENVGIELASDIDVLISSNDPYIDIVEATTSINEILPSQINSTNQPVVFTVAGNAPDEYYANFSASFSSQDLNWQSNFSILVHAPNFELDNLVHSDQSLDGIWDQGEELSISIDLINSGNLGFGVYPGALIQTDSQYVSIITNSSDNIFYGISANDAYTGTFTVVASNDAPPGTNVDFSITWGPSEISEDYCIQYQCPDETVYNFSLTIGLVTDSESFFPEDLYAVNQGDQSIYVSWEEVVEYDCNADAPYSDSCYAQVIDLDSYCCDFSWDGICESAYNECINRNAFLNQPLSNIVNRQNTENYKTSQRDVTGYYVFRDGEFITFTENTFFEDYNIENGFEYCYSVSAVYDSHQSQVCPEFCIESNFSGNLVGDINFDNVLNILDVVSIVNVILDSSDLSSTIADINNDSEINILDVILLVNIILNQ